MSRNLTRRTFLASLSAAAAASTLPSFAALRKSHIQFGYAAITWGNEERQAIDDIAAVGYRGIQLRANALTDFKPAELKDLLAQHKLTFVALSSGEISVDEPEADQIATHVAHAQFVKDAGGRYLQILDKLTSYTRTVTSEECSKLGKLLTELGKRTADIGIPLGYHNHLNTLSQKPENLDLILENSDPKYLKLELDTAHAVAGGGDPIQMIRKYHDRLLFMHLKDVHDIPADTPKAKYPFEFVELGRGRVDLPAVFAALDQVAFSGWAVVELDRVPDKSRTPKESATISKDYLKQKIGVKV
ncbi:sugar phosphate isomerase/epimerase family protein [Edaphobacter albus]|uniref:sugar phosphate isomerase/epimerase family protein n=1 Tax=Edaphobacter sp. 4G125 TaxID=2763071 RepID=UPI00164862DE|nr:sugar phosphate isomerase/epimerase [Edaphobacter sp. 4G125]QNI35805.1 TIM barrel protein [Edaphobacter sp. 4G125]